MRILDAVRAARGRRGDPAAVAARLAGPSANPIPARAMGDLDSRVALFVAMAEEVATTIDRVATAAEAPAAVARYLAAANLPTEGARAPDLDDLPWDTAPMLSLRPGRAEDGDALGVTGALAAIAETGTLMMASGPGHPSTLNFLPDTHVVVLRRARVVATYEDGWARLAARGAPPRMVNFITGPSRTADIAQTILLGAHGPRRLHVVLIEEGDG